MVLIFAMADLSAKTTKILHHVKKFYYALGWLVNVRSVHSFGDLERNCNNAHENCIQCMCSLVPRPLPVFQILHAEKREWPGDRQMYVYNQEYIPGTMVLI